MGTVWCKCSPGAKNWIARLAMLSDNLLSVRQIRIMAYSEKKLKFPKCTKTVLNCPIVLGQTAQWLNNALFDCPVIGRCSIQLFNNGHYYLPDQQKPVLPPSNISEYCKVHLTSQPANIVNISRLTCQPTNTKRLTFQPSNITKY